ncbi:MAG: glycosyltransferase [Alphaproteobacteria bacterium]|nr:glycosyltransferase [Alphaproteobacteria bacterium]
MTAFSVITVTRNNRTGLRRTHDSLAEQTCRDFEWIIIDGASTDGTPDDLPGYTPHSISEPDSGIYDAMNKGLARANGHYVLFLNAGDVLAGPDVLAAIKALPLHDFIYGDGIEDGFHKPARPHTQKLWGLFTYHQALLYSRTLINNLRYDTRYRLGADYKFTLEFLDRTQSVLYWPHPVCIFEPGGASQTQAAKVRRELAQIRRQLQLCGSAKNVLIVAGQSLSWHLRRLSPGLYRKLRGRI